MKKTASSPETSSHASVFQSFGNRSKATQNETETEVLTDKTNSTASSETTTGSETTGTSTKSTTTSTAAITTPFKFTAAATSKAGNQSETEQTQLEEKDQEEHVDGSRVQSGGVTMEMPDGGEDDLTKVDSPQKFANQHFAGVSGYSWEKLKTYLGSDGSQSANLKLRQMLNIFILHNKELTPKELWNKIETDPSSLKGYQAFQTYYGQKNPDVKMNASVSVQKVGDLDAGLENVEQNIQYTPRHFIFLTKNNIRRNEEASQEATIFIQKTTADIQQVMDGVNESKKLLESELSDLTSGLNQKMASDADSKRQLVEQLTGRLREGAQLAKDAIIEDYRLSLVEIDRNTSIQKQKLRVTTNQTAGKLLELKGSQQIELDEKFKGFTSKVNTVSKQQRDKAIREGNDRAGMMSTSNFGKAKKEAVQQEASNIAGEIDQLSKETIKNAFGTEDKASTPYQSSLENLYQELVMQQKLLDGQNRQYKESSRLLMEAHITKVDELAITAIVSLTGMLESYFAGLADFSTLEEGVLNAFYTGSVKELDEASMDMINQSRERLSAFQSSQNGLKKPGKRNRRKAQERLTESINPLLVEASQASGEVSGSNQAELELIKKAIATNFEDISGIGTSEFTFFTDGALGNIDGIRQKATPVIAAVSTEHLENASVLTEQARKTLVSEVATLKQAYQQQLIAVDAKLKDKLTAFKLGSEEILMDLIARLDRAEMDVSVSDADNEGEHGLLYNGFQFLLDNSPVTILINSFLESWRKIPKSERGKMMKQYMGYARAILIKMRNAPDTWLDDLIDIMFPTMRSINSFVREFQIGFIERLIELPDAKLAEAIENVLYNQTRLDFYIGMVKGIGEGIVGWFVDIYDTVKSVGEFIIDLFNIPEHLKKIQKISGKVADAIQYLSTKEGQDKFMDILNNFKPEDLINSIGSMLLNFAHGAGRDVADGLINFMLLGPEAMGNKIGRLMGYILMEILIAVFSEGIATAIKASLKAFQVVIKALRIFTSSVGKLTRKLAGEAVDAFGDAIRFIKNMMNMLKNTGKDTTFLKKLNEFIEGMMDFMKTKVDDAKKGKKEFVEMDEVPENLDDTKEWLDYHEQEIGVGGKQKFGHTIDRHVGKTDTELIGRLQNEYITKGRKKMISASSSYTDMNVAQDAISKVINAKRNELTRWLKSADNSNLPLNLEGTEILGRGISKKEFLNLIDNGITPGPSHMRNLTNAKVVLKKNPGGKGYYILTSHPY